jgi:squalene-hopene/tetraprenyl-beta-curcumene cyclase
MRFGTLVVACLLVIGSLSCVRESQAPEPSVETDAENPSVYLAELAAAGLGTYSREDPLAEKFSMERAMSFMDGVAVNWGNRYECVTCHTNGFYLTSPAALFKDRPDFQKVQEQAREYARSWPSMESVHANDSYLEDTYAVATAAFLSISELETSGELSELTTEILDRAWRLQEPDGHWANWIVCNWPPFESDYHFGVTLMAIVGGMAPESYMQTKVAHDGMLRLRTYLAKNEPAHVHNRGMMLWAARHVDGLITIEQQRTWVQELRDLQRDDGGWASGTLGNWRQRDGTETNPWVHIESDGYGTGFVTFILMQAGVPASDPAVQNGIAWLRANQRARGYWWTQSLRNNPESANFLTHTGTTFALKALAAADTAQP